MHYAENLVSMPDQKASILSLFSWDRIVIDGIQST